jgi:predicted DNA-binding transcriptional regulator
MTQDFTLSIYKALLNKLSKIGYKFNSYRQFIEFPEKKSILLRHDVDARKLHSLKFAQIQHELGIVGTYYFRMIPQSFDEGVIKEIASMGHEIGYHYEDMDFAKGDPKKAIHLFEKHLEELRKVAEVKTICMHGSPLSKYDNRSIWQYYNYRDYGIIAEPYFDLDFTKVLYLTDTGRRWDGDKVSIRDRSADASINKHMEGDKRPLAELYHFKSTYDIIRAAEQNRLPDQIMFNFHPQRWTDNPMIWTQELVFQSLKNIGKRGLLFLRR